VPQVQETTNDPRQHCAEDYFVGQVEPFAEEGRCYMMDTNFRTVEGHLVPAADLSIGDSVLDHLGKSTKITWCRKLSKKKRLLVDLHTKPFAVTGTHRVLIPGSKAIEAKELNKNDEVLIGNGRQQLLKVTKRYSYVEVVELEFAGDAIIEVHEPGILTQGSDPSLPFDQDGGIKCKEEQEDEYSMAVDTVERGMSSANADNEVEFAELTGPSQSWPDTDDDLR
jgi:hypothetical protein